MFAVPVFPGGLAGTDGAPGQAGTPGLSLLIEGPPGEDAHPLPGERGSQGPAGVEGAPGPAIPGVDGLQGEDAFPMPGERGPQGIDGSVGQNAPVVPGLDGIDGDDLFLVPGERGVSGAVGLKGEQGGGGPPGLDGIDGENSTIILQDQRIIQETSNLWNSLGSVAVNSGTEVELTTNIPSTARIIFLDCKSLSLDGLTNIKIELGTASGYVSAGYAHQGSIASGATIASGTFGSTGFIIASPNDAAAVSDAVVILSSVNGLTWFCSVIGTTQAATFRVISATGVVTLSEALTSIQATGGGANFDGSGTISLMYQNSIISGLRGLQGEPGVQGWQGEPGDEPIPLPGERGPQGLGGLDSIVPGPPGFDGMDGDDLFMIPGERGPQGTPGAGGTDPFVGSYNPNTNFTIATGKYAIIADKFIMTGGNIVTIQGDGCLRLI